MEFLRYSACSRMLGASILMIVSLLSTLSTASVSAQGSCQPSITVDRPTANTTIQGSTTLAGWAIDAAAAGGSQTGIQDVRVYRDGQADTGGVLVGLATKMARADVDAVFGLTGAQAGWTLDADFSGVPAGTHALYVSALTACGWSTGATIPVVIRNSSTEINVDTPARGQAIVSGRRTVIGGWAVDPAGSSGTGVDMVNVYADARPDAGGTLLGTAVYGKPRADVAANKGRPEWTNSGFDFVWNAFSITPGPHTLYVGAHSAATGQWSFTTVDITITARAGRGAADSSSGAPGDGNRSDNPPGSGYRADAPGGGYYGPNNGYNVPYGGYYGPNGPNYGQYGPGGGAYGNGYGTCPPGYIPNGGQCMNAGGYSSSCPPGFMAFNGTCYRQ